MDSQPQKFHGVVRNAMENHGLNPMEKLQGTPRQFPRLQSVELSTKNSGKTAKYSMTVEIHGNPVEFHGSPRIFTDLHGVLSLSWKSTDFHGAPWRSMVLHG